MNYINPTAIDIGPLSIKWYGIIIAVGILIGYFIAQESLKSIGLHKDTLVDIIFYCAIFGFLVAEFILLYFNGLIIWKIHQKYLKFGMAG